VTFFSVALLSMVSMRPLNMISSCFSLMLRSHSVGLPQSALHYYTPLKLGHHTLSTLSSLMVSIIYVSIYLSVQSTTHRKDRLSPMFPHTALSTSLLNRLKSTPLMNSLATYRHTPSSIMGPRPWGFRPPRWYGSHSRPPQAAPLSWPALPRTPSPPHIIS